MKEIIWNRKSPKMIKNVIAIKPKELVYILAKKLKHAKFDSYGNQQL